MDQYQVARRAKHLAFLTKALLASGFDILQAPPPITAPFVFSVLTPWNEPLTLICYMFTANKYKQKGRPHDEHRMQVKYGGDFTRFHDLYISTDPQEITLMFGVHLEAGILVAVDPMMHNPTWFSRSIEFKTSQVETTRKQGWFGWERERSPVRRKLMPQDNFQTEVLLGLRPERFADYVLLEQQCRGIPPGERLLAIDTRSIGPDEVHFLEKELQLSRKEILEVIQSHKRLHVAVRGAAAELHLGRLLNAEPALSNVKNLDADGQPDFIVDYRGHSIQIECKNTLRKLRRGVPKVDFQKTRASKNDPCSRYYKPEQFEILAACLHPVTQDWNFQFCPTSALAPHPKCPGHLSQHVLVDNGEWTSSVLEALSSVIEDFH